MSDKKRVLVVDDDAAVRVVATEMLKSLGYDVEDAAGGVSALARLDAVRDTAEAFAVVMLDVGMPGMSGVDVYLSLRADDEEQIVIFVTGYTEEEISEFRSAKTWVLAKPYSLKDLSQILEVVH